MDGRVCCIVGTLVMPLAFAGATTLGGATGREPSVPNRPATTETKPASAGSPMENAVVKVFSTVLYPDLYRPWAKQAPSEMTGSGVVIEGKRILTNAHLVLYASQVQVQANESSKKIPATVVALAGDIDLATLKLEDETLFDSHWPLARRNTLPAVKDAVIAYGYPIGGFSLSVTKGIVSRIEFTSYNPFGIAAPGFDVGGLRIQIDAAINPGNSGGPAVVDERMVGLAYSYFPGAQNIGYIIPNEEIDLFLEDISDGHYDGKPGMRDELQTLENSSLRSFLKLPAAAEGMVVHWVDRRDPAYPLKEWDLITRIGDKPIDRQGMISVGANLRIRFRYLIQQLAKDGRVPLTIVRDGRETKVDVPVARRRPTLLVDLNGSYPSYFVYGPLVFSTATMQFVAGFVQGAARNPMSMFGMVSGPLMKRLLDEPAFDGEELVLVSSPFFPHALSMGYSDAMGSVVDTVNGVRIRNLGHLVEVLRDTRDEFIVIEFQGRNSESLVFPREEMLAATDEIMSTNGVRSQGSPEILRIWKAATGH
jgi:S1-C subfamily serine protease